MWRGDCRVFKSLTLNALLSAELAAGNRIVEDGPGWGGMARLVILAGPFRIPPPLPDSGLAYRHIGDTHYWLAEVEAQDTRELLACRF
jgi:hypothetical protein